MLACFASTRARLRSDVVPCTYVVTLSWIGAATILLCHNCFAAAISADELIKNPKRFEGQRVTVRGIAEDAGNRLFIYADYNAVKRGDLKRMFVTYLDPKLPPYRGSNYGYYAYTNARWVKITGIVDMRLKGRFGFDPFGVRLERVEVLSSRIRELLIPLAYFRNDTNRELEVRGDYDNQGFSFSLGPRQHNAIGTGKRLKVSVAVRQRQVAAFGPMTKAQWRQYFDPKRRAFYFRITYGSIELVHPKAARTWPWDALPDRD